MTFIGEYAFYSFSELTSLIIPNSVNYIKSDTFADCTSLSTIFYTNKVEPVVEETTNKILYEVNEKDANGTIKVTLKSIISSSGTPVTEFSCDSMGSWYSIVGLSEDLTEAGVKLSEHNFGDWSNYEEDHTKHIRTCSKCLLAETEDHDDQGAECVSNNDATCTQNGTETATCSVCHHRYVRTVSGTATGHTFIGRYIPCTNI